jgi:hypothetical protein
MWRVPDSRGRTVDRLELSEGTLTFDAHGAMQITVHGESSIEKRDTDTIVVSIRTKRGDSGGQWRRVARAILKMGLCTIRREKGQEAALSAEWDPARDAVFGESYTGFLLISPLDLQKPPDLRITVTEDIPGMTTAVDFSYGGLRIIAGLGLGTASAETLAWAEDEGLHHMAITPPAT